MIVDFHTHTFPEKIAAAAIGKLQSVCHSVAFTDGTLPGLIASMARAGIHRSVTLPVATNPLKVVSMNDSALRLLTQPEIISFGCIHPDMDNPAGELRRIAQAGLKGIKLHPVYQGADIDDPRYLRILDAAGQLGLMVVMHAGEDIGYPGVVRCTPAMIRRALQQVGPVKLVCAHMGGWRCWEQVADYLLDTSVLLDTAFSLGEITPLPDGYYTADQLPMLAQEAFLELLRVFGSQRILFGTDSPWSDQAACAAQIRALPISQADCAAILGGNACRLLGLEGD